MTAIRVPHELEDALYASVAPIASGELARAVVDRSKRYTSERDRLGDVPPGDLPARALFFTVCDALKVAVPLRELARRCVLPARPDGPLRVVDLGAGCGAMTLGAIAALRELRASSTDSTASGAERMDRTSVGGAERTDRTSTVGGAERTDRTSTVGGVERTDRTSTVGGAERTDRTPRGGDAATAASGSTLALTVTAIDQDAAALGVARRAIETFSRASSVACQLVTRTGDVGSSPIPASDLVFAGNILNELAPEARLALIERALAAISDDGAVVIVEPALRDTARAVHELRDAILGRGSGHVFAPCTRRSTPCTALADPRDWCHEDRQLVLPPRTAELARRTHLRDSGMKFAYLVLRRQPLALVDASDAWRIVSAPMPAKGKLEIIGCGERGRVTLRLLKRNRSEANRSFERVDRGDVVTAEGPVDEGGRVEIGESTTVRRETI